MIKLLLVDDEKDICGYLKIFFSQRGYRVYTALTGQDALNIVEKEKPELVLLDINLPDLNGLEVLKRIKEAFAYIKVIIVTVSDEPALIEKAKNLGADEFIEKPFTINYLEDVVIRKVSEIDKDRQPPQILIVDDEEDFRILLRAFLKKNFNCSILEAANAEVALDLMKANKPDLIFLDIKMPSRSGMDLIKEKENLDYKPFIWVMTAFDSEEVARKVIDEGADDYLPKSFSSRVLNRKLRDFFSRIGKYKPKDGGDSV